MKWLIFLGLPFMFSCSMLQSSFVVYEACKTLEESSYVYALPYEKGRSFLVVQGYHSLLSHYGRFAVDFKMKPGTSVYAAREGIVVYVKDSFTRGGIGKTFAATGNGITIAHSDSTFAHYWHLQHKGALVRVGDTVKRGQRIGISGHTGFSAFPHLHFEVTRQAHKGRAAVPVLFQTKKGAKFLLPLRWYKAI